MKKNRINEDTLDIAIERVKIQRQENFNNALGMIMFIFMVLIVFIQLLLSSRIRDITTNGNILLVVVLGLLLYAVHWVLGKNSDYVKVKNLLEDLFFLKIETTKNQKLIKADKAFIEQFTKQEIEQYHELKRLTEFKKRKK